MRITVDIQALFDAVTPEQYAEVIADRAANHAHYKNTFNWDWWNFVRVDGKIAPKFWNNIMAKYQSSLFMCAKFYIDRKPEKGYEAYPLLAAALKSTNARLLAENPQRLTVNFIQNYTRHDLMQSARDSGLLIEL